MFSPDKLYVEKRDKRCFRPLESTKSRGGVLLRYFLLSLLAFPMGCTTTVQKKVFHLEKIKEQAATLKKSPLFRWESQISHLNFTHYEVTLSQEKERPHLLEKNVSSLSKEQARLATYFQNWVSVGQATEFQFQLTQNSFQYETDYLFSLRAVGSEGQVLATETISWRVEERPFGFGHVELSWEGERGKTLTMEFQPESSQDFLVECYEVAIGSYPESDDVVGWTDIRKNKRHSFENIKSKLRGQESYYVSVRAVDEKERRTVAQSESVSPPPDLELRSLQLTGLSHTNQAPLATWVVALSEPTYTVDHYEIAVGTTSGASDVLDWKNIETVTSYRITHGVDGVSLLLSLATDYYISVRAMKDGAVVDTITSQAFQATPPTLRFSSLSLSERGLTFQSPIATWTVETTPDYVLDHYEVALGSSNGSADLVDWVSIGLQTSYQFTDIDPIFSLFQQDYYFTVKAVSSTQSTVIASSPWRPANPVTAVVSVEGNSQSKTLSPNILLSVSLEASIWSLYLPGYRIPLCELAIGTRSGQNDVVDWVDIGTSSQWKFEDISPELSLETDYYVTLRLTDSNGSQMYFSSEAWQVECLSGEELSEGNCVPLPDSTQDSVLEFTDLSKNLSYLKASAQWTVDGDSDVSFYEVAIGTTEGGSEALSWTNVGKVLSYEADISTLAHTMIQPDRSVTDVSYYLSVRAKDASDTVLGTTTSSSWKRPFVYVPELAEFDPSRPSSTPRYILENLRKKHGFRLSHYEVAIGTTVGGTDVLSWKDVGKTPVFYEGGLTLISGTTYHFSVRVVEETTNTQAFVKVKSISFTPGTAPAFSYSSLTVQQNAFWPQDQVGSIFVGTVKSDKCLVLESSVLKAKDCDTSAAQKWELTSDNKLKNQGKCLSFTETTVGESFSFTTQALDCAHASVSTFSIYNKKVKEDNLSRYLVLDGELITLNTSVTDEEAASNLRLVPTVRVFIDDCFDCQSFSVPGSTHGQVVKDIAQGLYSLDLFVSGAVDFETNELEIPSNEGTLFQSISQRGPVHIINKSTSVYDYVEALKEVKKIEENFSPFPLVITSAGNSGPSSCTSQNAQIGRQIALTQEGLLNAGYTQTEIEAQKLYKACDMFVVAMLDRGHADHIVVVARGLTGGHEPSSFLQDHWLVQEQNLVLQKPPASALSITSSWITPFVTGLATMLKVKYPHLTAKQLKGVILDTADEVTPSSTYGKGRWNVEAALARVTHLENREPSYSGWVDGASTLSLLPIFHWQDQLVWPNTSLDHYEVAIGTTTGGHDVLDWTSAGVFTSYQTEALTLNADQTYHVSLRAVRNSVADTTEILSTPWSFQKPPLESEPINIDSLITPILSSVSGESQNRVNSQNQNSYEISGLCSSEDLTMSFSINNRVLATSVCDGINFQALLDLSSFDDGAIEVSMVIANGSGDLSVTTVSLTKDSVLPSISSLAGENGNKVNFSNKASYTVSGSCDDSTATLSFSHGDDAVSNTVCDGTSFTKDLDLQALTDGPLRLVVTFRDSYGNFTSEALTLTKDTAVPSVSSLVGENGNRINLQSKASYTVSGNCDDSTAALSFSHGDDAVSNTVCDGTSFTKDLDLQALTDGPIRLVVTLRDSHGNFSSETLNLTKDTVVPSVSSLAGENGNKVNFSNKASYTVSGNCDENSSTISFSQESTSFGSTTCSAGRFQLELDLQALSDGAITLTVLARDLSGNSSTQSLSLTKDTVSPSVSSLAGENDNTIDFRNYTSYTVSGSCTQDGDKVSVTIASATQTGVCTNSLFSLDFDFSSLENSDSIQVVVEISDTSENSFQTSFVLSKNTQAFISSWTIASNNLQLELPLKESFVYDFQVDWGDGSTGTVTSYDDPDRVHTYASAGDYTVTISGVLEAFGAFDSETPYKEQIQSVSHLGTLEWKDLSHAFSAASSLTTVSGGDVSQVTDMRYMFYGASNARPDVSSWDVSSVTDMSYMFSDMKGATLDVSDWDTSQVTNMIGMFSFSTLSSVDVSGWDTSEVTNMRGMFADSDVSGLDVSSWDVSRVTDMSYMFQLAGFVPDVSSWQFHNSVNLSYFLQKSNMSTENYSKLLIHLASLPQLAPQTLGSPVARDDGLEATLTARETLIRRGWILLSLSLTISGANENRVNFYNQRDFRVSGTCDFAVESISFSSGSTDLGSTACQEEAFSKGLNLESFPDGDVTITLTATDSSDRSLSFTLLVHKDTTPPPLSSIEGANSNVVTSVNESSYTLTGDCQNSETPITITFGSVTKNNVVCDGSTFEAQLDLSSFASEPILVVVSTQIDGITHEASLILLKNIQPFISVWKITSENLQLKLPLKEGFVYDFQVDWGDGNTGTVTSYDDPDRVHTYPSSGDYTVTVSGVLEAFGASDSKAPYKKQIRKVDNLGDVRWKSLSHAFSAASSLTTVSGGDVSQVTDMGYMFYGALNARPDVSSWDVSSVTDMSYMFSDMRGATLDVSDWDTSQVTNMGGMFNFSTLSSVDVSGWDTSQVTNMRSMFADSDVSGLDVSSWDVFLVTDMSYMFQLAGFVPDVSSWQFHSSVNLLSFVERSDMSTENYSKLLIRLASLPQLVPQTLSPPVAEHDNSPEAVAAFNVLLSRGWVLTPSEL